VCEGPGDKRGIVDTQKEHCTRRQSLKGSEREEELVKRGSRAACWDHVASLRNKSEIIIKKLETK
jgi:hypothetical protein